MEESSDESGEMITKEEAEVAELEQKNPGDYQPISCYRSFCTTLLQVAL